MLMIILGIILIAVGILMAFPFFGIGMAIPLLGDVIDIPISFILIVVGSVMMLIGGLGYFLSQFWWIFILGFAIWYLLFVIKIGVGSRRRR